jgi:hypothetical protein
MRIPAMCPDSGSFGRKVTGVVTGWNAMSSNAASWHCRGAIIQGEASRG